MLKEVREALVAYGGWAAGGYISAQFSKDGESKWSANFWGMVAAGMFSRFVDTKLEKEQVSHFEKSNQNEVKDSKTEISYHSNHADKIKSEPKSETTRNL